MTGHGADLPITQFMVMILAWGVHIGDTHQAAYIRPEMLPSGFHNGREGEN
jgi:hypothetical protein